MSIPVFNFTNLHNNELKEEVLAAFKEILDQNAFVEGKYNDLFETEFARIHQVKHCLLVANGTDALEIALLAHGIKHGDKVAVPGITFYATAEAVLNVGATPVFVDVDPSSGLIDPASFEKMHSVHHFKAVMPVHIYGLPAPIKAIQKFADQNDIKVIEDAAQASGTIVDGKPVGASGNLTTFSFYPTKNLSAFGDAGAILTNDDHLADVIRSIRNHGRGELPIMGRNSRCDHMQAAVLYIKLKKNEEYNQARKQVARKYHDLLNDVPVKLVSDSFIETSSWHLYPIHLESKEQKKKLQSYLVEKCIGTAPFYEKALSQEEALKDYEADDTNAKAMAGTVLCLPMNPFLSDEEITFICNSLKSFF